MSEYNKYVTAINKIFSSLTKMKEGWSSIDNLNYIETIDEYKAVVTKVANDLKNPKKEETLEELGND